MAEAVHIERTDEVIHGRYSAEVPGAAQPAELTWTARGEARIADHTFVPPEARGRGVAQQLVEALVADAREQKFTVVPQCSYVYALFKRHPEWTDVLAEMGSD